MTNFRTLKRSGTSQGSSFYQFTDESPFSGYSYYRLKQVDISGEFTLTEIRSVYLEFQESQSSYLVYPNPVNKGESVRLRYETDINKVVKVQVFDLKGFLLLDQAFELSMNQQNIDLDTRELSRGVNLIKITDADNKITTLKLIVR